MSDYMGEAEPGANIGTSDHVSITFSIQARNAMIPVVKAGKLRYN